MSFGAVLIARDDMSEETVRWHLRKMRELGFNSVKQFQDSDLWPTERLERVAWEEGLCPWWYGEGGWVGISDELCEELGIDPKAPIAEIRDNPKMIAYQRSVWKERIGRSLIRLNPEEQAGFNMGKRQELPSPRSFGPDATMPDNALPFFIEWLKYTYDNDLDKLSEAWNTQQYRPPSGAKFSSWEEVAEHNAIQKGKWAGRDYGRLSDVLRFKAAMKTENVKLLCEKTRERDPWEPNRVGGEMSLFLPFASRGTDMEDLADAVKETGSFTLAALGLAL